MPISTSAHTDVLDYFSKDIVAPGMIVRVAVRKKIIKALVLTATPIADAKHRIKTSTFALKKITDVMGASPISETTMQAMQQVARFLSVPIGAVIANTVPAWLFEMETSFEPKNNNHRDMSISVLQTGIAERFAWYTNQMNAGKRILILSPTEDHASMLHKNLGTSSLLIPPKPSAKKFSELLKSLDQKTAQIIIAQPVGLGLFDVFSPDIVVFENEHDNRYVRQKVPHIDMRMVGEQLAAAHNADVVYASTLARAYSHARIGLKEIAYAVEPVWPQLLNTDVVGYKKDEDKPKDRQHDFFSPRVLEQLEQSAHTTTLVYVPRKGLASIVVCRDCGTAVTCPQCELPCKLVEKKSGAATTRWFACRYPEHLIPAHDSCAQCGGHRLEGLGVSTLRMRDELQTLYPTKNILVFDNDTAAKKAQQKKIVEEWYADPNSLLIATSLIFPYLDERVTSTIIPSLDMLLAHGSPEAQESILHTLSLIEEKTQHPILVQTRLPDTPIFASVNTSTVQSWFATEQVLRKRYGFPPFGVWLSIHARLTQKTAPVFQANAQNMPIKAYSLTIVRGRKENELYGKALFKIGAKDWNLKYQDSKLAALLRVLPPGYWVEVASDSR